MKLKIKEIGPSGRQVDWGLGPPEVLSMLSGVNVDCIGGAGEAHLRLALDLVQEKVVGRGALSGFFEVACVRCLGAARVAVEMPDLVVTFVPAGPMAGGEGSTWDLEDADTFGFDGEEIDFEQLVRESLVLAVPIAPLCREACRGLCSGCGADLNRESCQCDEASQHSDWRVALARARG